MSPWGYLLFTGWATLAAILVKGWWLVGLMLVELAFGGIWSRRGLRLLHRPRFWMLILTMVALGPFLIGEPNVILGPLLLSRDGFAVGAEMAGRASALMLAFGLGIASLSLSDVVAVFDRLGMRGLGFAVALAMNLFETLRDMATVTWQTIRLRGGVRRPGVALRLFLITTIANALRYGDEVVNAATVRAFDPTDDRFRPLPLQRSDLWLLVLLVGCTGALWIAGTW